MIALTAIVIGMSVLAYVRVRIFEPAWLVKDRQVLRLTVFVVLFAGALLVGTLLM